ncbi:glycerol-3-phosphate dehydrogenase/oxidase [Pleionea sp. CnH1-48]|uniref:glycerol-3-phosphate dehydrogenase/oxidase n=1 Tax=Pleionea sp. CnH1-48 TaxID=2954494 RepID=UPI0020983EBE|nr:glycerol-3-phosphate dehydrogenase/oxidase [Pleionea sp. CnH1-48]MCO7224817.1 glycerol-3-phosphate dehydrogenase/oxidase [Pleionea sp. CnH1-48]
MDSQHNHLQKTLFPEHSENWQRLKTEKHWDVIVIGGGISGAGVLREASRRGYRALLVEKKDFAWGTSSRSSKMVHGGLRYLGSGNVRLTRQSLSEREWLIRHLPGLVDRMEYFFTLRKKQFPGPFLFGCLIRLYDWIAGIKQHRFFKPRQLEQSFSNINVDNLAGAWRFTDSVTDDSRLVMRVLQESVANGAMAINYTGVEQLVRTNGRVSGVVVSNSENGEQLSLDASVVINATGVWANQLSEQAPFDIRPLRGSHIVISADRLKVQGSLTLLHAKDKRPFYIFPWEGATLVGTTDLDHTQNLNDEACITEEEIHYMLAAVNERFPDLKITQDDVISCFSGVRPVISSGKSKDPSAECREHILVKEPGLISMSGGKLTTFRLMAEEALDKATSDLPERKQFAAFISEPDINVEELELDNATQAHRLLGHYGSYANELLEDAHEEYKKEIGKTAYCLAECRWILRNESVVHLDDLLLRRTRLGLLLPDGAKELFKTVQTLCQQELSWSQQRWEQELERYQQIYRNYYSI